MLVFSREREVKEERETSFYLALTAYVVVALTWKIVIISLLGALQRGGLYLVLKNNNIIIFHIIR